MSVKIPRIENMGFENMEISYNFPMLPYCVNDAKTK